MTSVRYKLYPVTPATALHVIFNELGLSGVAPRLIGAAGGVRRTFTATVVELDDVDEAVSTTRTKYR